MQRLDQAIALQTRQAGWREPQLAQARSDELTAQASCAWPRCAS